MLSNLQVLENCAECEVLRAQLLIANSKIEALETKILELVSKQKESIPIGAHTPSSQIPSFKKKTEKLTDEEQTAKFEKTKGGAKKGHKGHGRQSLEDDKEAQEVFVESENNCPYCNQTLIKIGTIKRSVIDLPPKRIAKIVYVVPRKRCRKCGRIFSGKPPVLPKNLYGNQLLAELIVDHYIHGVSIGNLIRMYGNELNIGTIIGAFHRNSKLFGKLIPVITQQFLLDSVKYADETSWKIDGNKGWIWLFSTEFTTLLLCERTRASSVPLSIFGTEEVFGFLVVDRYAGYNFIKCLIQYCYSHLSRDVLKLLKNENNPIEVVTFVESLNAELVKAMKLHKAKLTDEEYYKEANLIKNRIIELTSGQDSNPEIQKIKKIFQKNHHRLYHWVDNRLVPCHNNFSER
jgi:transposase-like protein